MTQFITETDAGGHSSFCPPFSKNSNALVLVAGVAQSFTVPVGMTKVFFQTDIPGAAIWVNNRATAVIPTIAITDGSAPDLNPYGRKVEAGDVLSVICDQACIVQASFFE